MAAPTNDNSPLRRTPPPSPLPLKRCCFELPISCVLCFWRILYPLIMSPKRTADASGNGVLYCWGGFCLIPK